MSLVRKFQDFIQFSITHKLTKMVKKKSDKELMELYCTFSPECFKPTSLYNHIYGAITVYIVGEELKTRYPNNIKLSNWDYTQQLDLFSIVGGKNNAK